MTRKYISGTMVGGCLLFVLTLLSTLPVTAWASEPFIGEIKMFAGNFAPPGYANCDGQLLTISGNAALFSLLGTTYGGDGETTFALPDLRGRVPVHVGQGPGLTEHRLGARGGQEYVTLTPAQMPTHSHTVKTPVNDGEATETVPAEHYLAKSADGRPIYSQTATSTAAPNSTTNTGGSQEHPNMPPYTTIRFIIALQGLYPSPL